MMTPPPPSPIPPTSPQASGNESDYDSASDNDIRPSQGSTSDNSDEGSIVGAANTTNYQHQAQSQKSVNQVGLVFISYLFSFQVFFTSFPSIYDSFRPNKEQKLKENDENPSFFTFWRPSWIFHVTMATGILTITIAK